MPAGGVHCGAILVSRLREQDFDVRNGVSQAVRRVGVTG